MPLIKGGYVRDIYFYFHVSICFPWLWAGSISVLSDVFMVDRTVCGRGRREKVHAIGVQYEVIVCVCVCVHDILRYSKQCTTTC